MILGLATGRLFSCPPFVSSARDDTIRRGAAPGLPSPSARSSDGDGLRSGRSWGVPPRRVAPAIRRLAAPPARVSAKNGASGEFLEESGPRNASFLEFLTSERVKVVAMLGLALALCNADRVVMSVAIVPLSRAHGWTQSFSGIVQSSFLWGYLMSPIVGGALVDYYGGKLVMAWGVALWSLATFLTPWAAETSLWTLLAMRVLLGVAEGVALPSMNNMVSRWFPRSERSRAVGIAMAGFQLGSAAGLLISPIIMSRTGVFGPFIIFGLFGFLWVLVWASATSSTPERHPQISKSELDYIGQREKQPVSKMKKPEKIMIPPFKKLLSKLPTWALIFANSMHSWGYFVILSWMPIYFNTSIGFLGPGVSLLGLNVAKSPSVASSWLTAAVGLSSFSHAGFLVNLQVGDIGF
ncbi:hypothetical protein MUK42_19332 [Musa troglodytarum]|uniref:Major facilitator superfamily (MFS) profile domain-containing protein n=1 Tax=Musa troglodytarum TaxID=320322 RepID=A0A9E7FX09_9LILI|nr:hypothetical protein MUK42_19332 [Musa troglodytarum]